MTNPQDTGSFDFWITARKIFETIPPKVGNTGDYEAWLSEDIYWHDYVGAVGSDDMAAITRGDMKVRLAKYFGYAKGTASAGSTTTITGATSTSRRLEVDDYFNNWYAYIGDTTDDAAPKAEERYVTDYVQSTGVLTVNPAFSAAVGNGDVYHLCTESWAKMEQALEESIYFAWPHYYKEVRDITSLDTTTSQFYSLPTDSARVLDVSILSSDGYEKKPLSYWEEIGTSGNKVLYTKDSHAAGDNIEIVYLARPMFVTATNTVVTDPADTDYLNISYGSSANDNADNIVAANYMIWNAAKLLWTWRIGRGSQEDSRDAVTKVSIFDNGLNLMRDRERMPPRASKARLRKPPMKATRGRL